MKVALEETVARVADPETPVVWLDPTLPGELWDALPAALEQMGFRVLPMDHHSALPDLGAVLQRLAQATGVEPAAQYTTEAALQILHSLYQDGGPSWVLLWRHPEPVRQENESRFEEFIDMLEALHDEEMQAIRNAPKLVVAD